MKDEIREKRIQDLENAGFSLHFHFSPRHKEHCLVAIRDGEDRWYFGDSKDSCITQAWGDLQGEK